MNERPSPKDFIKRTNAEDRAGENEVRTWKVVIKLVKNPGILGGDIEEEKSQQVCEEILGEFGAGYRSVEEIANTLKNPSATDRQREIAKENLGVLGKSVFLAMNKTFANFSEEQTETITSQMKAEDIDEILPTQLKGLGTVIKQIDEKATDEEKIKAKKPIPIETQTYRNGGYDENLAAERIAQKLAAGMEGENGDPKERGMPLFMMTKEDIVTTEMMQRNKEQFHFSPPYPPWFKELGPNEQRLWMVRIKLVNGAAYKQALRNVDAEKLMFNRALDISRDELKLLLEMPKFQESMQEMFTDLLEWEDDKAKPGFRYLRLKKRERTPDEIKKNVVGRPLDDNTKIFLTHFEAYKEQLALRMDGEKEPEKAYSSGKRASIETRSAVGAAWNFLYVGNLIESADVDRQLKPTEIVSDKIRTMIHPLQKALGKWGVYKEGQGKLEGVTGEEEPMGGDIASWVKYHLELGEIRGDSSFRNKLLSGEIKPFPKRTLCSIAELFVVEKKMSNGKVEKNTMAELIMKKEKIQLGNDYLGNDLDIYSDYRDIMDGCKTAYTYLSGAAEYGKNPKEWARKFNADIALIRQYNANGVDKKTGVRFRPNLNFVDDPEFTAWVIAASTGFDHRGDSVVLDFFTIKANDEDYDLRVNQILRLPGLVEKKQNSSQILERLSVSGGFIKTKAMLFRHRHTIMKNEGEMKKFGRK